MFIPGATSIPESRVKKLAFVAKEKSSTIPIIKSDDTDSKNCAIYDAQMKF